MSSKIIQDPVHGSIKLSNRIFKLIDTPEFQRLRKIKQLSQMYLVFPSADHTRFEHCIGVAFLAKTWITMFHNLQPELNITDREIEYVTIGGLLHDIGHGPFSHSFEAWLRKKHVHFDHEEMSERIIRSVISKSDLGYTDREVNIVCGIVNGVQVEGEKAFLFEIVHNAKNSIDVDKWDYLMRDSYKIGFPKYDPARLMNSARIIGNEICFQDKDAYEVSELFQKRFSMWKKVYSNSTSQIFGLMFEELLDKVDRKYKLSQSIDDIDKFCRFTDTIVDIVKFSNDSSLKPAQKLITDIEKRRLYKKIGNIIVSSRHNLGNTEEIIDRIVLQMPGIIDRKNVRVTSTVMNYALKDSNPINYVSFYNKEDITTKFHFKKNEISRLLPEHFSECCIRVFSTSRQEDIVSNITQAFEQWKAEILVED